MSDRRPHWDAELLDAVGRSMHAFYDRPDAMHVYAVIAVVEDNRPPSLSDLRCSTTPNCGNRH